MELEPMGLLLLIELESMLGEQFKHTLCQVNLMRVIQKIVRGGVVENVTVDVLSAPPLFVDELVHDFGV